MHQIIAITILFVKLMLILKSSFHLYPCTKSSQEAREDSVIPILQTGRQRQADLPEADTNPAQLAWSTGWRCGTQGPVSSAPCPCPVPRNLPGRAAPSLGCKVGRERLYHNLSLFPGSPDNPECFALSTVDSSLAFLYSTSLASFSSPLWPEQILKVQILSSRTCIWKMKSPPFFM